MASRYTLTLTGPQLSALSALVDAELEQCEDARFGVPHCGGDEAEEVREALRPVQDEIDHLEQGRRKMRWLDTAWTRWLDEEIRNEQR